MITVSRPRPAARRVARAALVALALVSAGRANAQVAGVGAQLPGSTQTDDPGTRTNVEIVSTLFLTAGTYNVNSFTADIGQLGGSVQPFLALVAPGNTGNGSGTDAFAILAAGSVFTPTSTGVMYSAFAATPTTITVAPGGATVYVGITNPSGAGPNPVRYRDGFGLTDHNNPGTAAPATAGTTLGGFSNPNLGRTYAVSVSVTSTAAVPLVNGSFEANGAAFTSSPGYSSSGSNPQISGWTSSNPARTGINTTDKVNPSNAITPFAANTAIPEGRYAAFIQSNGGAGALSQTLPTLIAGRQYMLQFYVNARQNNDVPLLQVTLGSQTLTAAGGLAVPSGGEGTTFSPLYTLLSYNYTATAADALNGPTLSFANIRTTGDSTLLLDYVTMTPTAVPEPGTLLAVGAGGLALIARRRRSSHKGADGGETATTAG